MYLPSIGGSRHGRTGRPPPPHWPKLGAGSLERRRRTAYRHMIKLASYLKYKKTASENAEICVLDNHTRLTPPPRGTFTNIRINLIPPETTVIGIHFAADSMGLSSFRSCGGLRKTHLFSNRVCIGRSRSSEVVDIWHHSKGHMRLPISH